MESRNRSKSVRAPPYGTTEEWVSDRHTATTVIVSVPWLLLRKNACTVSEKGTSSPSVQSISCGHTSTARSAMPVQGEVPETRQCSSIHASRAALEPTGELGARGTDQALTRTPPSPGEEKFSCDWLFHV